MSASTALEVVRMGASAIGAVLAFVLLVMSIQEVRRVRRYEAMTRDEAFQQTHDEVGAMGGRVRGATCLLLQLVALYVAHEAYLTADASVTGTISDLALKSNLGQILWIGGATGLTIWDIRDIVSRHRIDRLAAFVPARRPSKTGRRREIVEVDD